MTQIPFSRSIAVLDTIQGEYYLRPHFQDRQFGTDGMLGR